MPLDKTALGTAIAGRLDALFAAPASPPSAADVWGAIAEEMVNHIVQNGLVTVTIPIGAVLIGCTGPGVVPIPNPAPIPVTGTPASQTGGIT